MNTTPGQLRCCTATLCDCCYSLYCKNVYCQSLPSAEIVAMEETDNETKCERTLCTTHLPTSRQHKPGVQGRNRVYRSANIPKLNPGCRDQVNRVANMYRVANMPHAYPHPDSRSRANMPHTYPHPDSRSRANMPHAYPHPGSRSRANMPHTYPHPGSRSRVYRVALQHCPWDRSCRPDTVHPEGRHWVVLTQRRLCSTTQHRTGRSASPGLLNHSTICSNKPDSH